MTILGRHRIRATFYHFVALVFLASTALWYFGFISDLTSYMITAILFIVDYIAEMYDPHPENPGTWYAYFHRAYDNTEGDEDECVISHLANRDVCLVHELVALDDEKFRNEYVK